MQDLIARLKMETGLSEKKSEEALGIVLSLIKTQGNQTKVEALFAKLPGAEELALRHGGTGGGGLLGKLGGGLMGGPLVAISKLQAKGSKVYVIREDLTDRGIAASRCVPEAEPIGRAELVELMETHDQVWHW